MAGRTLNNTQKENNIFLCGRYCLDLSKKTHVMGIINVTPDSFSDGGRFFDKRTAIKQGLRLAEDGADIIDIGGESSRPGSAQISAKEEFSRIGPVVKKLVKELKIPISIDTYKSEVAERCLDLGAAMINDITALTGDIKMKGIIARYSAAVVLMHMQGAPATMQKNPHYKNVNNDIISRLKESIVLAKKAGISKNKIIIDPGIGFGKTVEHNLVILKNLADFKRLRLPVMVGASRKSFIGKILNVGTGQRLFGSIAAAVIAAMAGADMLRVHDVKETKQALLICDAISGAPRPLGRSYSQP